jgi:hypothetical protein
MKGNWFSGTLSRVGHWVLLAVAREIEVVRAAVAAAAVQHKITAGICTMSHNNVKKLHSNSYRWRLAKSNFKDYV